MAMTPDAARSASKNPLTLRNNQRSFLEGGVISNREAPRKAKTLQLSTDASAISRHL
jgi:hypothetical protein